MFLTCAVLVFIVLMRNGGLTSAELLQVHVVFRHGDRTNDLLSTYPNDPYINETYYPYGIGQLTNAGRRKEYTLGLRLRERYDAYLGNPYTPDVLDAITTDTSRTKMSVQLVTTGLYNPQHTELEWHPEIHWQPIPYNYVPRSQDRVLCISYAYCANYILYYLAYLKTPRAIAIQAKYKQLFEYLTKHTGKIVNSTSDVFILYFGLTAEQEWGFELPAWTIPVFPQKMREAVLDQYDLFSATNKLKELSGGFFIKKIISDMNSKISGTLSPEARKIFLYSSHEINITYILQAMEIYFPHVPPYGAYILVELHKIGGVYGVKIFYEDYSSSQPKQMKIPGCGLFCNIRYFQGLLKKNIPDSYDVCEGSK